jgi:hypothetical protein
MLLLETFSIARKCRLFIAGGSGGARNVPIGVGGILNRDRSLNTLTKEEEAF